MMAWLILKKKRGVSYAISAVIVTSVTVILVLISGIFAYQVLDRQRGSAEFEIVKKSFASFDDAVRDVAWDLGGVRSARFTAGYGRLELLPNDTSRGLPLIVSAVGYSGASYSSYTGYARYRISTNYVTYGNGYEYYIFGSNKTVVSSGTESFGRLLLIQDGRWVNISLTYRVRAMRSSAVNITIGGQPVRVNYVDISIIKLVASRWATYASDFDLKARNIGIVTKTYGMYDVTGGSCTVSVNLGGSTSSVAIDLDPGKVVFNFVIAEVQMGT